MLSPRLCGKAWFIATVIRSVLGVMCHKSSCYWNHITFFSKTVVCTKFSNYTVKDQNPTQTRVNVNSLIRAGPSVLLMSPAWRTGRAVLGRARNIKYSSHQTKTQRGVLEVVLLCTSWVYMKHTGGFIHVRLTTCLVCIILRISQHI